MSLASVSLLVALGNISWTPYAERYMYGPAAMLAIGCSLALGKRLQRFGADVYRPYVISVVLLLLTGWFAAVFHRGLVWQDNLSLFTDTVNKSPGFSLAQNELAKALWERGRKAEALEIVRSLDIPDSQVAFLNRVMIFIQEGKLEEARTFLLETLSRRNSQGYHTIILERLIDITELMRARDNNAAQRSVYDDEIIGYLQELWHRTQNPFHLYRLGQRQLVKGNIDGAFESFMRAYEKSPPDSIYREPALKLAEGLKGQ
jgi:tetratricopeptide (TPR) repeat protein